MERLYEIVNGEMIDVSPRSPLASGVATRLMVRVGNHAARFELGESFCEMLYRLPTPTDPGRSYRPNASFVSYARSPRKAVVAYDDLAWKVVPDLVAEVVSPETRADALAGKVGEYFEAGVRTVWVVYPSLHRVHIYDSPATIRCLTAGDDLDGASVLPGLRVPLAGVFGE